MNPSMHGYTHSSLSPQEKMYNKIVLYTSSFLMIAGAYMMK